MTKSSLFSGFLISVAPLNIMADPIRFDFDSVDPQPIGPTQEGWTSAPAGTGSDGTVSIATSAIGAVTLDTRNREGTPTDAGGGNEAAMWNDFVFANGSFDSVPGSGLEISVTGLAPESSFNVTIWAFDDASDPAGFDRATDWNIDNTLTFPEGPDPETLDDYRLTFVAESDAAGNMTLTGLVAAIDPSTSHNVFINGLEISDPLMDVDGDGMEDSYEQQIIDANPDDAITSILDVLPGDDFDADGSTNSEEEIAQTNPADPDSDADGYLDGVEDGSGVWTDQGMTGTDPKDPDSDGDGLLDGVENPDLPYDVNDPQNQPGTDPNIVDTDNDGRNDGVEVFEHATDPTDENDFFDPLEGAVALFDFQPAGGQTQEGWTAADLGNGTNGTISVTTEVLGEVTVDTRDRDQANTNDGDVANNDMWRDFVFANGSFSSLPDSGLRVTLSGLLPFATYPVTIWAFDESSDRGREADWSVVGGEVCPLTFPTSPDPASLEDYLVTIQIEADASGTAVLDGIVGTTQPDGSHNVFVNGLMVGPPTGGGPVTITDITYDSGTVSLTWDSTPDTRYVVYYSRNLLDWIELIDEVESQGESTTFDYSGLDPDPSAEKRLFFRVDR